MSRLQDAAVYEMWLQGLHRGAAAAEKRWASGKEFQLEPWISVPRTLRRLLEQCNREARARSTH